MVASNRCLGGSLRICIPRLQLPKAQDLKSKREEVAITTVGTVLGVLSPSSLACLDYLFLRFVSTATNIRLCVCACCVRADTKSRNVWFLWAAMASVSCFRCPRCPFFAFKFMSVIWHLEGAHSEEPRLEITCGIQGCQQRYAVVSSLRSHLYRKHQSWISHVDGEAPRDSNENADASDSDTTEDSHATSGTGQFPAHHLCHQQTSPSDTVFHETSELQSLEDFAKGLKQTLANLFFRISEARKVPNSTCESLFQEVEAILKSTVQQYAEQLRHALSAFFSVVPESLTNLLNCSFLSSIFDDIRSKYQRVEYAKSRYPFTEAQKCTYNDSDRASFYYVPVGSVLRNFMRCKGISEQIMKPKVSETDALSTFREGAIYKKHVSDIPPNSNQRLIHLLLYTDELEIANPLGAARGVHKLLTVYYSVLNEDAVYRSQLKMLHLALIAKYADVQRHGMEIVLRPLLAELNALQDKGLSVMYEGKEVCVKVVVLAFCGDNLSMHRLGGFSCNFAHGSVCRFCMAQIGNISSITREDMCQIRSKELHQSHLEAIQVNPALYKRLYGLGGESVMSSLQGFDVTSQLPPDIMHDVFEGTLPFVMQHVLKGLFDSNILSASDLDKVRTFQYGRNDVKNKPLPPSDSFVQGRSALKGTASQKLCLFRLLPQIFGSSIPEGNEDWEVYLLLREILDMLLSDKLPMQSLSYLEIKIQEFLRSFVNRYPSVRLIPKMHYLIHYPRMISLFGPLKQLWCMRFEAKHQYFKSIAMRVKNFKNVCQTLANRHQLLQSFEFSELTLDAALSTSSLRCVERSQLHTCIQAVMPVGIIWQAKSVSLHQVTYKVNDVLVMLKGDDPQFCQIIGIYIAHNEVAFLLERLELLEFARHRYAFRVAKSGTLCAAKPGDEAVPECLDLYFGGELVPSCEVVLFE